MGAFQQRYSRTLYNTVSSLFNMGKQERCNDSLCYTVSDYVLAGKHPYIFNLSAFFCMTIYDINYIIWKKSLHNAKFDQTFNLGFNWFSESVRKYKIDISEYFDLMKMSIDRPWFLISLCFLFRNNRQLKSNRIVSRNTFKFFFSTIQAAGFFPKVYKLRKERTTMKAIS